MTRFLIGIEGQSVELDSIRRLVGLADHLALPDNARMSSNLSYLGVDVDIDEVKWDVVS